MNCLILQPPVVRDVAEKICEIADYVPMIETAETGDFVAFTVQ